MIKTRRVPRAMIRALFLGACLAAVPALARASTGDQKPSPGPALPLHLPSEKTAFTLSLVSTLASYGLLLASWAASSGESDSEVVSAIGIASGVGVMIGPSLGGFYGGCWGRSLLMIGIRVGVSALTFDYMLEHDEKNNAAQGLLMVGAIVGTSIYECATVKSAVRKRNAGRLAKRGLQVAAAPFPFRKGAGLNVRLSF